MLIPYISPIQSTDRKKKKKTRKKNPQVYNGCCVLVHYNKYFSPVVWVPVRLDRPQISLVWLSVLIVVGFSRSLKFLCISSARKYAILLWILKSQGPSNFREETAPKKGNSSPVNKHSKKKMWIKEVSDKYLLMSVYLNERVFMEMSSRKGDLESYWVAKSIKDSLYSCQKYIVEWSMYSNVCTC